MSVSFFTLSKHDFARITPAAVDLYLTAMAYPSSIRAQRIAVWRSEVVLPGFASVAAFDDSVQPTQPDSLVGIAYGFIGNPDRWWDQQLRRGLADNSAMNEHMENVINSYFELAEIHVSPAYQGHGIGRELMHRLLGHARTDYVLLSTPEVPGEVNAAFSLYRSLGFEDVLRNFTYTGDERPFAVLGRSLPLGSS